MSDVAAYQIFVFALFPVHGGMWIGYSQKLHLMMKLLAFRYVSSAAWNNSIPNGKTFVKFYTVDFYENFSTTTTFRNNRTKITIT